MNPAHFFTILRICISPLFPLIYLGYERLGISLSLMPYLLLSLLIVSEFSDIFDGFLARKRNQVTDLGKVLDPMADSITHISLFLAFTRGFVQLPLLIVLVFFYRDFFISTLRTLCALRGVALAARWSGKVKAIMQAVVAFVIVILMIPYVEGDLSLELFQYISLIVVSVAAIYTALSTIDYCYSNRAYIKKAVQG
jgi:CDP-diacylglycerol---glycerol-3-phosphate 3-phosphatidyltransferase